MSGLPVDVLPGSVDIAVLIFVMSALHPDEWERTINNIHTVSLNLQLINAGRSRQNFNLTTLFRHLHHFVYLDA